MPKDTPPPTSAPAAAPAAPVVEDVTLDEFCQRRSQVDRRVELLSAFHSAQTRAQKFKAQETVYAAALDAFANQPV